MKQIRISVSNNFNVIDFVEQWNEDRITIQPVWYTKWSISDYALTCYDDNDKQKLIEVLSKLENVVIK